MVCTIQDVIEEQTLDHGSIVRAEGLASRTIESLRECSIAGCE